MTLLFSLTMGVGAYLVFVVQPQVGKWVLPLLGGTPAVWNTCIVFFQLALLAGYAYAHLLGRLDLRAQGVVHGLLLLVALALLPLRIEPEMAPSAESPAAGLFLLLATRIGVPFFALSATAPLVQRWLSCTRHPDARDPYFLYAASNVGSLLALLTYPALVEPWLDLREQSTAWAAGYGLLLVGMGAVFALTLRSRDPGLASAAPEPDAEVGAARRARWIALAAVPSSLMLSVTTHLTTDVAAVPLLWVLALALYLLTFILAFARRQWIPHRWMCALLPAAVVLPLLGVSLHLSLPWWLLTLAHLLALFTAALVCHGALAADRPPAARLTEFYLWISVGGALGGMFNALIAPLVFDGIAEYPLGLLAACVLRPDGRERARDRLSWDLMAASLALLAALVAGRALQALTLPLSYALALPVLAALSQSAHARRSALLLTATLAAAQIQAVQTEGVVTAERGFFGVVKVLSLDDGEFHAMLHGNIVHGVQRNEPGPAPCAISYYVPVREAFDARPPLAERRVGVVGLGIGTLLACGTPGEQWRFYEINPDVVQLASDSRYFRYLSASPVQHDIVVGEGRLALATEPAQSFDVLILDAFASDAIPVHLMTREAFAMYVEKLEARGLLLVNISNRYLDLVPVVSAIAAQLGLEGRLRTYTASEEERKAGRVSSLWIALARDAQGLGALAGDPRWSPLPASQLRPWTDGYSSLLRVMRWTQPDTAPATETGETDRPPA